MRSPPVIAEVPAAHGRVDVLLHAAGLEISHALPDKEPAEYDLVFGVKSDGWFNLMQAIGDMPLGATVVFSSVAGRFGNLGQTDYARRERLVVQAGFGHADGAAGDPRHRHRLDRMGSIGMASRGSIPKMMERAGIEMLPPAVGIPTIRRELTGCGHGGEVVVAGRLGVLLEGRSRARRDRPRRVAAAAAGPMVGRVVAMTRARRARGRDRRSTRRSSPSSTTTRSRERPVLPGCDGHRGLRRGGAGCRAGLARHRESMMSSSSRRSSSTGGSRARLSGRGEVPTDGDALVADCRLIGSRALPTRPSRRSRRISPDGSGGAGAAAATSASAPRAAAERRAGRRPTRSTASTSTVPPTRSSSGRGATVSRPGGLVRDRPAR